MTNPLDDLNAAIDPLFQLLNKARQEWDTIPLPILRAIPLEFRTPVTAAFAIVEGVDRKIGLLREAGFISPKNIGHWEPEGGFVKRKDID